MPLTLYSRSDCGLCDEALGLLGKLGHSAVEVDVEASDELMAEYGLRIPVLADGSGRELGWPFDLSALQEFVADE